MINKKQLTQAQSLILGTTLSLAISVGLVSGVASAAQQGHIKLTSSVQKLIIVNQNGKRTHKLIEAKKVLPGETVQYSTTMQNISRQSAGGIKVDNPIPAHTVYLQNSAYGKNMHITFSVDGGRQYGLPATLKVRGNDGKIYPAKASDYTNIRWEYKGSLAPKEIQQVGFKARLL